MKNRVKELVKVKASELRAHPDNWRLHPEHQRSALTGLMEQIGVVDAVIARRKDGQLHLLDGHLRAEIMGDDEVPVLIVDLDDQEAAQMLATFDPVGDLAKVDHAAFARLMPDLGPLAEYADLRLMLDQIHKDAVAEEAAAEASGNANDHFVRGMDLEPHEHFDYIVVLAKTTHEWNVLCNRLQLEPTTRKNRVGAARGISAARLLDLLGAPE